MSVNMLGEAMIRAGQSLREGLDNQHKGLTRIAEALERRENDQRAMDISAHAQMQTLLSYVGRIADVMEEQHDGSTLASSLPGADTPEGREAWSGALRNVMRKHWPLADAAIERGDFKLAGEIMTSADALDADERAAREKGDPDVT